MGGRADAPEEWFRGFYDEHWSAIARFVQRRIDIDLVDDVVADTFLVAWRRRGHIPVGAELPWLYGVARGCLGNARRGRDRRNRLTVRLASEATLVAAASADELAVGRLALAAAFDRLAEGDREVLRLHVWERLPASQAALVLGCSAGAYAARLTRARRRLATHLADADFSDGTLAGSTPPCPVRPDGEALQ